MIVSTAASGFVSYRVPHTSVARSHTAVSSRWRFPARYVRLASFRVAVALLVLRNPWLLGRPGLDSLLEGSLRNHSGEQSYQLRERREYLFVVVMMVAGTRCGCIRVSEIARTRTGQSE